MRHLWMSLLLVSASLIQHAYANGVIANFTLEFKAVPQGEIMVLQNAIEDVGYINDMPVRPISLSSPDVPGQPVNVTAVALSATRVQLDWSKVIYNHPSYYIVGYTVFFKEFGDDNPWLSKTIMGNQTTSLIVDYLKPYTLYTSRVLAFHEAGNGISSSYVDCQTHEGLPTDVPPHFQCKQESETEIALSWDHLDPNKWNGYMKGYQLEFVKYNTGTNYTRMTFTSGIRENILGGLEPFTKYEIYIRAMTNAGLGPRGWCVQSTQEGTPIRGPVITQWLPDPAHPMESVVRWDHIPEEYLNGILTGYLFTYGYSKVGKDVREFPDMTTVQLDKFTTTYVLRNLPVYTETKIEIYGLTSVGRGVASTPAFVETCRCPQNIYSAWFENKPYVSENPDGSVSGIWPTYLKGMLDQMCGSCDYYSSSIYWDRSKSGHSPKRTSENNLKQMVADNVHMHVAMFGRAEIETFQSDFKYVSVIGSPGIAWVVRDPEAELDKTAAIMTSLASCWPAIIIIVLFSMVAGIVIWIADCHENKEDFPNESFIQGLYHGTYWAFVSMTTVGYGDKTPRSFAAQIVAICWMLMGPIINGIVIGAITTSMTSINLEGDPKIYGARVAAIHHSFEYNLGVRRNAILNHTNSDYPSGKIYTDNDQMIGDLADRFVDGILIDSLVAADMADKLTERKLKIAKLIPEPAGWGIILSGDLLRMETEIRSYVKFSQDLIKNMVENATDGKLEVKKVETEKDTGLIDQDSPEFKNFVKFGLISYVVLAILGVIWEQIFKRIQNSKIKPFSEEHRELLEEDLAESVGEFCDEISEMINTMSGDHERELKRLFWKKGYSFGVDGWLREKTNNEEELKNKIRYHEIMSKDLGFFEKWKKGKQSAMSAIGIGPIRVSPAPQPSSKTTSQQTLKEHTAEQETMA